MLVKSIVGYGIAATVAYICWIGISKFINEKLDEVKGDFWKIFLEKCSLGNIRIWLWGYGYHTMLQILQFSCQDNLDISLC